MICQNCHASVDNDLIFCTNCGARLHENTSGSIPVTTNTVSETPTVVMGDSVVTKVSTGTPPSEPPEKSNFKWVVLIIALIAIPAAILTGYLLFKPAPQPVVQNTNATQTPIPSPSRKANTNTNAANIANTANTNVDTANIANVNTSNTNLNINSAPVLTGKSQIMNERIEISPNSNYAVPFKVDVEKAQIFGNVTVTNGEPIEGYVFLKDVFEEHYVEPTYKVFSFDVKKDSAVEQTLVKGEYVLIFVNKNDKSTTIQSNFYTTK